MKKIIAGLSFLMILFLAQNMSAQHHGKRGHHGKKGGGNLIEEVKADLNLTENQEAKLEELKVEFKAERRALRTELHENESLSREEMHKKMTTQREAHFQKVMDILDSNQQAILKTKKEEMDSRMAQRKERKGERMEGMKKMKTEAKTYREQNIRPTLAVQRAKLESVLSAEDKATIDELRPVFEEMKQRKEKHFEGRKERKERPTPEMREKMKAEHLAMKEQMKPHHEKLKSLVEKYDADIQKLFTELEKEHEVWKKDLEAIHEKYAAKKEAREDGERPQRKLEGKERHGHRGHRGPHGNGHKDGMGMKKVHFLLMKPSEATSQNLTQNALTKINVFPNPASNLNTINYEVRQAGLVKIELKNESGKTLRTLTNSAKEVGEYSMEVDLSDLRDGVYYYTITDGSGVISKKIVVSK